MADEKSLQASGVAPLEETWGKREFIDSWSTRGEWQKPIREMQMAAPLMIVPHPIDAPIRVLDLAAGYGTLAGLFLEQRPKATAVCLDVSAEMIKMGREQMARYGDRVEFVQSSIEQSDWLQVIRGEFDVVVSARALHHFSENQRRRYLYREIFGILRPGGCFINADNMRAPSDFLKKHYRSIRDGWLDRYVQEKTEGKQTFQEIYDATQGPSHSKHINGLIPEELAWLTEAGFENVDCYWKFLNYAVYGGFKPL